MQDLAQWLEELGMSEYTQCFAEMELASPRLWVTAASSACENSRPIAAPICALLPCRG